MKDYEQIGINIDRAASRIPEEGPQKMNINSFIASLTDLADISNGFNPQSVTAAQKATQDTIGIFAYLRDTAEAQTIEQALAELSNRKIKNEVVRLWAEEGMVNNHHLRKAIEKGYPELGEVLKRKKDERMSEITTGN